MIKLQAVEKELKESYDKMMMKKEQEAVKKIKKNPKYFYSFASKSAKMKNKVGPLQDEEGEMKNDPEAMADILSRVLQRPIFLETT